MNQSDVRWIITRVSRQSRGVGKLKTRRATRRPYKRKTTQTFRRGAQFQFDFGIEEEYKTDNPGGLEEEDISNCQIVIDGDGLVKNPLLTHSVPE